MMWDLVIILPILNVASPQLASRKLFFSSRTINGDVSLFLPCWLLLVDHHSQLLDLEKDFFSQDVIINIHLPPGLVITWKLKFIYLGKKDIKEVQLLMLDKFDCMNKWLKAFPNIVTFFSEDMIKDCCWLFLLFLFNLILSIVIFSVLTVWITLKHKIS